METPIRNNTSAATVTFIVERTCRDRNHFDRRRRIKDIMVRCVNVWVRGEKGRKKEEECLILNDAQKKSFFLFF